MQTCSAEQSRASELLRANLLTKASVVANPGGTAQVGSSVRRCPSDDVAPAACVLSHGTGLAGARGAVLMCRRCEATVGGERG